MGSKPRETPKIFKLSRDSHGYWVARLSNTGRSRTFHVSRLVLLAFVGEPSAGWIEAAHEDGNIDDNSLTNLSWKTKQANIDDQLRHGTRRRGEDWHQAKLTNAQVLEMRSMYSGKRGQQSALARYYRVTPGLVSKILSRRIWDHI